MRFAATLTILLGLGQAAHAQAVWASATVARSSHRFFDDPAGVSAGATFPLLDRIGFRATYNLLDDSHSYVGRACSGLLPPPPACPEERLDGSTALRGLTLGIVGTLVQRRRMSIAVVPAVSFLSLQTRTRGIETGGELTSSDAAIGFGAGVELSIRLNPHWPVSLHGGARIDRIGSRDEPIADGYSPFFAMFDVHRLDIGLSVATSRRGRSRPPG